MSYRYLGNKTRLTDWLVTEISASVPRGARVADPMCGTGAVSIGLAKAGFSVTASDSLTFPTIHARTRLLAKSQPRFEAFGGYKAVLEWLSAVEPREGYFFNEFGDQGTPANGRAPRLYFSAENAALIDGVRHAIRDAKLSEQIDELEHAVLLQNLILATNKVANISGTYGYFRRTVSGPALKKLTFEPLEFIHTPGRHFVTQGKVEEIADSLSADAVYLDPPYTKRQYAGNYHVLETLALEDCPPAVGDGGLRPWSDQASDFCYRRKAPGAFRTVLDKLDTPHIFISYSEDGQVPPDELFALFSEYGQVTQQERTYPRYRSNRRGKSGEILERLYHITKETAL